MKTWLSSKLLWDPSQDDVALTWRFLQAFYGAAVAPLIREYMQLFEAAANDTLTVLDPEDNCLPGPAVCAGKMAYLAPETLLKSVAIFQRAAKVVDGTSAAKQLRLAVAELPTLYVILLWWEYVTAWAKAHSQPWPLSRGMDQCVWCERPGENCGSPQRDNALGEWTGAGLTWFKKQIGA